MKVVIVLHESLYQGGVAKAAFSIGCDTMIFEGEKYKLETFSVPEGYQEGERKIIMWDGKEDFPSTLCYVTR